MNHRSFARWWRSTREQTFREATRLLRLMGWKRRLWPKVTNLTSLNPWNNQQRSAVRTDGRMAKWSVSLYVVCRTSVCSDHARLQRPIAAFVVSRWIFRRNLDESAHASPSPKIEGYNACKLPQLSIKSLARSCRVLIRAAEITQSINP